MSMSSIKKGNKIEKTMTSKNMKDKPRVLLLGMVYANDTNIKASVGQEYRDRMRCQSLEGGGYNVFTMDDKHTSAEGHLNKHCRGNFCDTRRFDKWLQDIWSGKASEFDYDKKDIVRADQWDTKKQFNCIILDYYFSPDSWASVRWADTLFMNSIPTWATDGTLTRESKHEAPTIWLPNIQHVDEMITANYDVINQHYSIDKVEDPMDNPLYNASNDTNCYNALVKCREQITNETQLPYLMSYSDTPFYRLTLREISTGTGTGTTTGSNKKRKLK